VLLLAVADMSVQQAVLTISKMHTINLTLLTQFHTTPPTGHRTLVLGDIEWTSDRESTGGAHRSRAEHHR
jgi:hypothetical protein